MEIVTLALSGIAILLAIGLVWFQRTQSEQVRAELREIRERLANADRAVHTLTTQILTLHKAVEGAPSAGGSAPKGLLVGEAAPDFALPDVGGISRGLADYAGQSFLVLFFDTGCGFCQKMQPRLGRLSANGPRILIVGRGDLEKYRQLSDQAGWPCEILFDARGDLMGAYRVSGTPSGYLVDEEGRIASELAQGEEQFFQLFASASRVPKEKLLQVGPIRPTNGHSSGHRLGTATATVATPEAMRIGDPAPEFVLEDLNHMRRSLSEWAEHDALLVFVEAGWPAHDQLVLRLAQSESGLSTIVVVEDGTDADRKRIGELAAPLPVLIDDRWHVARLFGVSATPTAYIIERDTRIVSKTARGPEAVIGLQSQVSSS